MGLRHRSIRLRVGILIVVPVLCLLTLYGLVVAITLSDFLIQSRANTVRAEVTNPVGAFQLQLATERQLALQLIANPSNTTAQSKFGAQESKTQQTLNALALALQSSTVAANASSAEKQAINTLIAGTRRLSYIRGDVTNTAFGLPAALDAYDSIINAGYPVLDAAIDQETSVPWVTQALNISRLDQAGQAAQAESDLLAADIAQGKFPFADRTAFAGLASLRQSLLGLALPELQSPYKSIFMANPSMAVSNSPTALERKIISTPWRAGVPPSLAAAPTTFSSYTKQLGTALSAAAVTLHAQAQDQANTVLQALLLTAGLGLLGIIVSIVLSLVLGRGLLRQLRDLRQSALTLARDKLPNVISQLRAGQPVDVTEYEPGDVPTDNEIEQVQHAFGIVQQTAVQTAVDEARLRRGISDVFRNLAGRSQSLLHRQLTLLDGMERRATEPDELEDLFRIDHLTTRMRRHAEGLIILSGETPARGWRQPVPLVDVLRAAVAEVEDYTRIRVLSRTNAAVAGHAVADVIHLIAELAENATVFSPPNTPVRIHGDVVGRGFAVEIEDRGLGISPQRLTEINASLADPPQFDLSGSDRLGLFIASQLAQRHDIKVTLRQSVYGGTTAIVLIPTALVVEADSYERDPALPAGQPATTQSGRLAGRHELGAETGRNDLGRPTADVDPDYAGTSLAIGSQPTAKLVEPAAAGSAEPSAFGSASSGLPVRSANRAFEPSAFEMPEPSAFEMPEPSAFEMPEPSAFDAAGPSRPGLIANGARGPSGVETPERSGFGTPEPTNFGTPEPTDFGTPEPSNFGTPEPSNFETPEPSDGGVPERTVLGSPLSDGDARATTAEVTDVGLPVRVRQASLAPQLRNSDAARPAGFGPAGLRAVSSQSGAGPSAASTPGTGPSGTSPEGTDTAGPEREATAPPRGIDVFAAANRLTDPAVSPEEARNTVSALQRGWQLGRSEAAAMESAGMKPSVPSAGDSDVAAGPADPDQSSDGDEAHTD
jgi:signal transduction histidine kinase